MERVRCSACNQIFDSMDSFNKHTCKPKTVGGASDVYQGEERLSKYEGGAGGGRPSGG